MGLVDFSIERIVMIDDSFVNENTFLRDIPEEVIMLATFQDELRNYLEDENDEITLRDFFEDEGISQSQQDFFFENINKYYKFFDEAFEGVVLDKFLPEEFNDEKIIDLENTGDSILFIIDKKLSDRNYTLVLRDVLEKITSLIKKKNNCFLFIYTSEVENLLNYDDLNSFLSDQVGLSPESIKIISLHINFVEKKNELKDSIVDTAIRKSQKAKYLYSFDTIQRNTMEAMNKRIWEINNNELLIHYNYLSEGQHIDEILFDIYISKFFRVYEDFYRESYIPKIRPLRKSLHSYISNVPKIKHYATCSRIIKELNKEFEKKSDLHHQQLSSDISYGDIIKINNKFYLVCSQQCDITIRAEGRRANKSIELLELKKSIKYLNAETICRIIDNILQYDIKSKDKKTLIENLIETDEFKILVNDSVILKEISDYFSKEDYKFKNDSLRNSYEYFEYKKRAEAISIHPFILDSILLRSKDDCIKITENIIDSCKDIRYSTKRAILRGFSDFKKPAEDLIEKTGIESGELLKAATATSLPELEIDYLVSNKKVTEICLRNICRIGRLDFNVANSIHQTYIENYTRIPKNEAPVF
ncbi:hypothetical protein MOC27_17360 [Bacillus inaquosorum]|uniref:hypothetical protein n=1 Tax=Bacillus inaquosorum TaxID=483913 RepID=UPI0022810F9C|nr:hypothetical protein [Bacillus inaquosorum]MCY7984024.1 hypothetical protein [Bacillus inaquosorum]MCY8251476.1 hypothetical protein [Bacillus inaquosorum]MCY8297315.1 hypothetical protein [Bacillus inaquosorum]MCY8709228.1 hypothetical protein [Bacillus inaquosorum]